MNRRKKNPPTGTIGAKIKLAIDHYRAEAAMNRELADMVDDAWKNYDWALLHRMGVLTVRDLKTIAEE